MPKKFYVPKTAGESTGPILSNAIMEISMEINHGRIYIPHKLRNCKVYSVLVQKSCICFALTMSDPPKFSPSEYSQAEKI